MRSIGIEAMLEFMTFSLAYYTNLLASIIALALLSF